MDKTNVTQVVADILEEHKGSKLSVIAVLQDVQEALRYLPREAFEVISKETGISMAKLYVERLFGSVFVWKKLIRETVVNGHCMWVED